MNSESIAPIQTIESLLKSLKLSTLDQLVNGDSFNIDTLSKTSSLHPIIIRQKIALLQSLLVTSPQFDIEILSINVQNVISRWIHFSEIQPSSKPIKMNKTINQGDIVEIIGRVGSGKSFLLNELIIQCLLKEISVVYFDGAQNNKSLIYRIKQEHNQNQLFVTLKTQMKIFSFKTQTELIMLLHSLGQWVQLSKTKNKIWVFIDSLSRTDQPQVQNSQSVNTLEFKSAQKTKRVFFQLSQLVGAIIYSTKCMNSNSLFDTIYKQQKHRPKGISSCAKQWDNLANKTICIDFGCTSNGFEYNWINFTKDIDCSIYKFKRQH